MGKPKVKLNPRGVKKAMQKQLPDDVDKAAQKVVANVSRYSTGTRKERNRSGRPVTLVALTEPNGVAIEAKHGTLANAARAAGLKVHRQ